MSVSAYVISEYGGFGGFGWRKNKANLSLGEQSQIYLAPRLILGV